MYIIVIGAGRLGGALAKWLVSAGHEISVIEVGHAAGAALDDVLGAVSVYGDSTDADVLAKAGANRADAVIATTRMDDINLAACQLAKHRFGVSTTISVVNSRDHTDIFDILGIDMAIEVTELVLGRIQEGLSSRGVVHLAQLSDEDGKTLVSIKIPNEAGMNARPIKDVSLPEGTLISLVISREGDMSLPSENTIIRGGDEVLAITTVEQEEALRDLLIETSGK